MQFYYWNRLSTEPMVFEDETLLAQQIASDQALNGPCVVESYQHALVRTNVYGTAGGSPVPVKPPVAIPVVTVALSHVRRG